MLHVHTHTHTHTHTPNALQTSKSTQTAQRLRTHCLLCSSLGYQISLSNTQFWKTPQFPNFSGNESSPTPARSLGFPVTSSPHTPQLLFSPAAPWTPAPLHPWLGAGWWTGPHGALNCCVALPVLLALLPPHTLHHQLVLSTEPTASPSKRKQSDDTSLGLSLSSQLPTHSGMPRVQRRPQVHCGLSLLAPEAVSLPRAPLFQRSFFATCCSLLTAPPSLSP